jgi:hypothetical protein
MSRPRCRQGYDRHFYDSLHNAAHTKTVSYPGVYVYVHADYAVPRCTFYKAQKRVVYCLVKFYYIKKGKNILYLKYTIKSLIMLIHDYHDIFERFYY